MKSVLAFCVTLTFAQFAASEVKMDTISADIVMEKCSTLESETHVAVCFRAAEGAYRMGAFTQAVKDGDILDSANRSLEVCEFDLRDAQLGESYCRSAGTSSQRAVSDCISQAMEMVFYSNIQQALYSQLSECERLAK